MRLLNNSYLPYTYSTASFGVPNAAMRFLRNTADRASDMVKRGGGATINGAKNAADSVGEAVSNVGDTAKKALGGNSNPAGGLSPDDINSLRQLADDGKESRNGVFYKMMALSSAASLPFMVAPLMMEDANTRAVKKMREEDKAREAAGLPPLSGTTQMMNERANPPAAYSKGYKCVANFDLNYR